MTKTKDQITDKYTEEIDKAWVEFQNNNYDKAEAICNALVIEFPETLGSFYLLGHIYSEQGQLEKALEQFSIALEKDKEKKAGGHINYWIGRLYNKYSIFEQTNILYNTDKAKQCYHKAIEYENYPPDVIYQLQYEYKNDYDRIKFYEEGIKKFPNETNFYILISQIYTRLEHPNRAIERLNDALEKGLKSASLYYNVGEFYFRKKQFSQSRTFYTDAINLNEHYPHSNYALNYAIANSFFNEGDFFNAETYYKKSFEESSNKYNSWFGFFGLILVYTKRNKIEDAQNLISEMIIDEEIFFDEEILSTGPFWLDSQVIETITLAHDKKKINAIFKSLKFSEKNNQFLGKLWLIKGLLAKIMGKHLDRYTFLKNSLKYLSAYKHEFLYIELCSIYTDLISQKTEKEQDLSQTIKLFKSDLENYPVSFRINSVQILDTLINALFKAKYYKDIVEIYHFFTEEQVTEAEVWFEVGYSLNEIKEYNDAKIAYEKHINIKGESSASLNNLANIYKSLDNLPTAIELYKRGLELDPKDETLKNNLARTLKQLEKIERDKNQKKALDVYFKSALKLVQQENNFVIDKLSKFILNIKRDESFKNWEAPIQKYKFPVLMGTDKQKAESLRIQWLKKNYIQETDNRDAHNVIIYLINPYLETEITKINNSKIPENWISGFDNVSIGKLEDIGYFELASKIQKVNKKFKPLLERDFNELVFNYIVRNEKATIVLSGSLVELALTYHCEKKKTTQIPYIDSKGNPKHKKLYDCVLNDLISYAEKHLFFGSDFPHLSNLSRIYRNFIHPGRELKDKLDKPKCDLCFISTTEILRKVL
ncbi:MAG: tetratricopeptide repeat protein [Bacteroidota bacterium]|nr:tetratricopeptide repeat protein [Bacteroidota bacterium]